MHENIDRVLMVVLAVMAAGVVLWRLNRWLTSPQTAVFTTVPIHKQIEDHPALELLLQDGYEVIGGKVKINLSFQIGAQEVYSRLFVDYVASDEEGQLYLVKLSRERMAMDWSGASVRDRLMPVLLMYPDCAGLLYVDDQQGTVRKVTMEWTDEMWSKNHY
ncbi:hypothetical protein JJQ72_14095 [Paenibacillus sp. F411]|uniref:hypothetical protein n=1 Tax=Paenibacillus sp. F411 TaxID=2820239 RepID=UPI001AB0168F|nr:hypothetical protein [Paenibacillus sp. F411]MBO2945105.1 hypothetical protein [Paenibacillus sp. F411]